MKTIFHRAEDRGRADYGWLKAKYSFSFANYYDPNKIHFGALRVLNDDLISPMMGFGTHPHDNMEIVSIILDGTIKHKDSMGNTAEIHKNEVQIMSAGTGIYHSEFNSHKTDALNLLQIWIMPKKKNIEPRYDQMELKEEDRINTIQTFITPDSSKPMWINQDAWFSRTLIDKNTQLTYTTHQQGQGVYAFVIDGEATIADTSLKKRDAVGIYETESFEIKSQSKADILLIEVPMNF
jgi:redox-sensitive bicupin YhaK (pirin superfamily)